jgi:5-methylcytosine-specific restriction endonuclease McrA
LKGGGAVQLIESGKENYPDYPFVSDEAMKRERNKARLIRQSDWWKNKKSGGVCYYCKKQVGARNLTMDHKVPIVQGGRSTKKNIVPACPQCNASKQGKSEADWFYSKERDNI